MNARFVIIVLSVMAVGLSAGIVSLRRSRPAAQQAIAVEEATRTASASGIKYKVIKDSAATTSTTMPTFHWSEVESADYKEYIAKLREIQCPEQTIRDIILADINKLYAPREAALRVAGDEEDSVSSDRTRRWAPFERRRQLREIQKEKNALLKELLGIELSLDPLQARGARSYDLFEAAFKALPAEKQEIVREIQENYWQTSDALKDKYANRRTAEYVEDYKRANLERKAQLANALTPEELEEYEMRTTNVARNMQYSLEGFNPTEEEFKTIFKIRKAIEEPYGGLLGANTSVDAEGNVTAQDQRSYADRQREITEKIKEALGPERAKEYELSRDGTYQQLKRLGQRFGLAPDTVMQSYDLQKTYREQQTQLRQQGLAPEQRNAAMQQLQQNYDRAFAELVGERAAKAFQGSGYVPPGVSYQ